MPAQAAGWNNRLQTSWRLRRFQQTERRNVPTWPIGGLYDFESAAAAHFNRALLALAGQPGVRDRHEWAAFDRTAGAAESCGRAASRRRDSVAGLSDGTLARGPAHRTLAGEPGKPAGDRYHTVAPEARHRYRG